MLIALLFTAFASFAQQNRFPEALHGFKGTRIVRHGVFEGKPIRFEDIKNRRDEFANYDQFLDFLFREDPKLLSNYVLMTRSESQQFASLEHPRVLLFNAGVFFGLSDHPDQKSRRVEILETDPKTYDIRLHEIVFNEAGVEFRENPASCVACHGSPAKPLWNPYDFWPNAFGAAIGAAATQPEIEAFRALARTPNPTPIFQRLKLPKDISRDTENVTLFTQVIQQINLGRWISQNLGKESKIGGFAEPLMAAASNCGVEFGATPEDFGMSKLKRYFRSDEPVNTPASLTDVGQDIKGARKRFKSFLDQILGELYPGAPLVNYLDHNRLADEVIIFAQMQWVLNAAGIDGRNMTSSAFGNDFLITSPSFAPLDFLTSLYEIRPDLFEGVEFSTQQLGMPEPHWILLDCDSIRLKSRKASRDWQPNNWRISRLPVDSQPTLSRCSKCHVPGIALSPLAAPPIPFNNPFLLSKEMGRNGLREKILSRIQTRDANQMPPGNPLSETEVIALREFLDNIETR